MTIQEIEQLSFEQLKARRDALAGDLKTVKTEVLAVRYLRTLIDAKHRDEKLAEQGKTVTALQDGAEAGKTLQASLESEVARLKGERATLADMIEANRKIHLEEVNAKTARIAELEQMCREQTQRGERLKKVAARNGTAVSQAAKLLNDALAEQAVEEADQGE